MLNEEKTCMTNIIIPTVAIVLLASYFTGYAANPSTPSVVNDFYSSMEALSNEQSASRAYDLQLKMQHCFLYGKEDERHTVNSGIEIPNDFISFGYKNVKRMSSTLYTQIFKNMAYTSGERLRVSNINIKSSALVQEVDLKNYARENKPYVQTFVTRTFTLGSTSITFNDTILTQNNLICAISNGIGGGDGEDLECLRALAARFYTWGAYRRAFQIYEKIIRIDPKNANAYYRMGILAFWHGKRCGLSTKKKVNKDMGKDYMRKAIELGAARSQQVYYYMIHSPI